MRKLSKFVPALAAVLVLVAVLGPAAPAGADLRYHGQALMLTIDVPLEGFAGDGLERVGRRFDELHEQLYTFALDEDKEIVSLRAIVQGKAVAVEAREIESGGEDPSAARLTEETIFVDDGEHSAAIYDRARLRAGNRIAGPAIVTEMDSTTLILPDHVGEIDRFGNILIRPAAAAK